jgi:hypothetical protein
VPAPLPPAKGGGALKIILIVVGVFVALGVLAACVVGYGVYRVSKAVHVDKNGNSTMTIGSQTITTGSDTSISASDLGVDVYPGAAHAPGSMNMKSSEGSMTTASYTTSDSVTQVVDFYKSKLGENATTMETGGGTILTSGNNNPKDNVVITVSAQGGKTKIGIVHSTKKN